MEKEELDLDNLSELDDSMISIMDDKEYRVGLLSDTLNSCRDDMWIAEYKDKPILMIDEYLTEHAVQEMGFSDWEEFEQAVDEYCLDNNMRFGYSDRFWTCNNCYDVFDIEYDDYWYCERWGEDYCEDCVKHVNDIKEEYWNEAFEGDVVNFIFKQADLARIGFVEVNEATNEKSIKDLSKRLNDQAQEKHLTLRFAPSYYSPDKTIFGYFVIGLAQNEADAQELERIKQSLHESVKNKSKLYLSEDIKNFSWEDSVDYWKYIVDGELDYVKETAEENLNSGDENWKRLCDIFDNMTPQEREHIDNVVAERILDHDYVWETIIHTIDDYVIDHVTDWEFEFDKKATLTADDIPEE